MLPNHNPSNQRSERIPLVLTYHPLNERIKRILLRNFNILPSDPETRAVFSQPRLVAYRRDSNLHDILVHTLDTANPVLRRVHPRAYMHSVSLSITFLATPTSVALNTLLSSRRRFLAKRLAWSTVSPVPVALLSIRNLSTRNGTRTAWLAVQNWIGDAVCVPNANH